MGLFNIKVKGSDALKAKFNRSKNKINKLRGANLAAAITVQKWVISNIELKGELHNDKSFNWPPLKPSTIMARRKGGGTGEPKPLQDKGRLKGGFNPTATNQYGLVVNNVAALKSNVKYADYHESGTSKIPQRKMFPTVKQGEEIVKPVYEAFVKRSIV